eukprot:11047437-Lingulodinium_polyedra.AAC.1
MAHQVSRLGSVAAEAGVLLWAPLARGAGPHADEASGCPAKGVESDEVVRRAHRPVHSQGVQGRVVSTEQVELDEA